MSYRIGRTLAWAAAAVALCAAVPAVAAPAGKAAAVAAAPAASGCDRACLSGVVDQYLASMLAHDPAKAPLDPHVRYTENGVAIAPGMGLWMTLTRLGPNSLKVIDAVAGQVAFEGTGYEHETLRTFTFRLRVQDGKITEIEQIVSRDVPPIFDGKAQTWAPDPILLVKEKAGSMSREAMARRADSYYAAIELNDDSAARFENCSRDEMGKNTGTDGTCGNDFKDMRWSYIEKIRPRRMLVIDEETGVVYGFACFEQTGHMTSYVNPRTGKVVKLPDHNTYPLNVYAGVAIKVRDDRTLKVQGIWTTLPYGMPIPWDQAGF